MKILAELKKHNTYSPQPLSPQDLIYAQKTLLKFGFAEIPEEFCNFLHQINGFAYEGEHIFGIIPEPLNFMDIINVNILNKEKIKQEQLILADNEFDFLIFESKNKSYQIVDKQDLAVLEEYNTLEQGLNSIIK